MAIGKDRAVLRQLRTLFNVGTIRELTDGQLLERFAIDRDRSEAAELAFAVLVERHGPMVLRVCRSVLTDSHEAQDAFQATFLVLVQKARGLWIRDSLGPWLHQVAYRVASCARTRAARRRQHERRAAQAPGEVRMAVDDELGRSLHEEIDRLPERFRALVVLCDLEGCTHEQAARHLGLPVGTVKSRLSRGRDRLRDRLRHRGLAPNLGGLATALSLDGPWASPPPALVDTTARLAFQFATVRSMVQGTAASLAQGVLRTMSMTRCLKMASVLFVAGGTVSGTGLLLHPGAGASGVEPQTKPTVQAVRVDDPAVYQVKPGPLVVTVVERGSLESSSNQDLYSNVEGQTTIIKIVPEGTRVKKGDAVCELDSAAVRDQLVTQRIATQIAAAAEQNARLVREGAEIAVTEYVRGITPRELTASKGEIAAAESAVRQASSRLERTRLTQERLNRALVARKGDVAPADLLTELDIADRLDATEQTLLHQRMALELAKARHELLRSYTGPKTTKALEADVEQKRAIELAKIAALSLEKTKQHQLERQILACSLTASADGLVVYADEPRRSNGGNSAKPQIEEGATVYERQKILTIVDIRKMQVNAKVHERWVDKLSQNMKATIRVDAFPEEVFHGTVVDVAPRPDPAGFRTSNIKVYTTHVRIDHPIPGLRPGMTALVDILVAERDHVLAVPVEAVLSFDGKDHLVVRRPDGGTDLREVVLGIANEKSVEVKQGIESEERVVLNPRALMSEEGRGARTARPRRVTPSAAARTPDSDSSALKPKDPS